MSNTNVLVLGHSGFIGKPVANFLRLMKVPVLGLSTSDLDLTDCRNISALQSVVNEETVVVFCSAIMPGRGGDDWDGFHKNLAMVSNSVKAFSIGIKKLVFMSTTGIYGDSSVSGIIDEKSARQPQTLYTWAKLVSEEICGAFSQQIGTPLLILRPTIVYGPRNVHQKYNPTSLVLQMMNEGKMTLFGKGEDKRDFIYVDDLAEIIGLMSLDNVCGDYNVGSGVSYSFLEVATRVKKYTGVYAENDSVIEYKERRQPVSKHHYNIRKLTGVNVMQDFKFTPLSEGIRDTVNFYRFQRVP